MRIIVDHDKCTGLGICESIAEEYFEVADDGALHLLQEQIDPADTERIDDAVRSCPTQALRIGES
nr:ferredoxin [Gordonia shandongensis]